METPKTTCIVLRLRRTIHEDAYVAVPATDAIMKREPEADGTLRIDADAFVREAIRLSENEGVEWCFEERKVEVHSIQRQAPEDRRTFDIHRVGET